MSKGQILLHLSASGQEKTLKSLFTWAPSHLNSTGAKAEGRHSKWIDVPTKMNRRAAGSRRKSWSDFRHWSSHITGHPHLLSASCFFPSRHQPCIPKVLRLSQRRDGTIKSLDLPEPVPGLWGLRTEEARWLDTVTFTVDETDLSVVTQSKQCSEQKGSLCNETGTRGEKGKEKKREKG